MYQAHACPASLQAQELSGDFNRRDFSLSSGFTPEHVPSVGGPPPLMTGTTLRALSAQPMDPAERLADSRREFGEYGCALDQSPPPSKCSTQRVRNPPWCSPYNVACFATFAATQKRRDFMCGEGAATIQLRSPPPLQVCAMH